MKKFKYYVLLADIDGTTDQIFGSYIHSQVKEEKRDQIHSLKDDGYRKIRIETQETTEAPDPDVYDNNPYILRLLEN